MEEDIEKYGEQLTLYSQACMVLQHSKFETALSKHDEKRLFDICEQFAYQALKLLEVPEEDPQRPAAARPTSAAAQRTAQTPAGTARTRCRSGTARPCSNSTPRARAARPAPPAAAAAPPAACSTSAEPSQMPPTSPAALIY
eukprot:3764883-Rhodomonas_salina.1